VVRRFGRGRFNYGPGHRQESWAGAILRASEPIEDSRVQDPEQTPRWNRSTIAQYVAGCGRRSARLQSSFLLRQGLAPSIAFLDIGLRYLRGASTFHYLNPGNYLGIEKHSDASS